MSSACILGAGLGLWARPSDLEHSPMAVAPRAAMRLPALPPPHRIEIRVTGAPRASDPPKPAPVAAEVKPPPVDRALSAQPAAIPAGLVRVQAPAPAVRPAPLKAVIASAVAAPAIATRPKPAVRRVRAPGAEVVKAHKAEPVAAAGARARRLEVAQQVRAHPGRTPKTEPAPHALASRGRTRGELVLARTRGRRGETDRRAPLTPHATAPAARLQHVKVVAPQPHAGLRMASAPRCASRDPAVALVCADPALGAADRRLARAYREAEAAGVPEWRLESQQQRWLAARATAARQAPWAVHDVYVARIAELQDEIREAQAPD